VKDKGATLKATEQPIDTSTAAGKCFLDMLGVFAEFADRPYADPEKAARKLLEIDKAVEPVQDRRIHIERINEPFLYKERGTPAEYGAGLGLTVERGWLRLYESGSYVNFAEAGASLCAIPFSLHRRETC
jgi:hypothetical protein